VKEDANYIAAQIAAKAETAVVGEAAEDEAIRAPLAVGATEEV
jgi:hypothetical protein